MSAKGKLYGVGVGPGDIELLTLKAARLLNEVRVIAYPSANGGESLARRIVAPLLRAGTRELPLSIPMERERERARLAYDHAAGKIASHLDLNEDVLFLCEGDPFFYGSFMFIHERLADKYECDVVPGVTSLTACAAALGRPLAARNEVLKVIPAPLEEERLRRELETADAVAIIKVANHFDKVRRVLCDLGLANRAAIIERATQGDQRIARLTETKEGERPYFSTVLVYKGGERWR
ncbi:MAG TPA: precorrin-2 C(20)-methyltransferase [Aestuariivirgaceae bacterium]|jgi:precorrin-2/cobalt-factor-2 C20-methyltransferase